MPRVQKFVDELILLFSVDAFSYADYLEASLEMEYISNETEAKMMADSEEFLQQLLQSTDTHTKTRRTTMVKREFFGVFGLVRWAVEQLARFAFTLFMLVVALGLLGFVF